MRARKSSRIATSATGSYRTPRGSEWEVEVADLSRGGCRVDDPVGGLKLGEYVQLRIGSTGPHTAEVAWRQGDRVGLEFASPLAHSVMARIAEDDWDGAADEFANTRHHGFVRRFV